MNAFAACLGLLCLVPVDAWAFASDHFSGTQLDAQLWAVEDPVGDANFAVGDGTLTISLPAGTPHDVWTTGNNSARVMQATADSDFEIEAKFTSLPTLRYQLQGLLVEQDAHAALRIADRGYVMETGRVVADGTAKELLASPRMRRAYLGIA